MTASLNSKFKIDQKIILTFKFQCSILGLQFENWWYGVTWEVARVKQGTALSLNGLVTNCVISGWHLNGLGALNSNRMWSDNWIDFHGQDIMCWEHRTQNASVQLYGTVHLTAFNILVELLNYRQTAHLATYSLRFKRCVFVCRSERLPRILLRNPGFKADLLLNYKTVSVLLMSRMVQPSGRNM